MASQLGKRGHLGKRGATCVSFLATELRRKAEFTRTMGNVASWGQSLLLFCTIRHGPADSRKGVHPEQRGSLQPGPEFQAVLGVTMRSQRQAKDVAGAGVW